ncbi:MAG TPA: alpha/beta hydrolase [Candidatus Saccharimonadales bacterium]|nr:alpha/beta hydrolase [Candidatus Saccharimonadales bacterium]
MLRRPYKLAASQVGEGRPLLLLHGVGSSSAVWEPLVKKLDRTQWQITTVDLLGFGKSPRPYWNQYDVKEHGRAVRATLRKLKIREPLTIVGHSMGCLVAAHVAVKRPGTVGWLVLYEPPLFADVDEFRKHTRVRERYFQVFEYILAHPEMLLTKRRLLKLVRKMYGLRLSEEDWLPFERSLRNTIMQQRLYEDLQSVSMPTDIIHGRLDLVVTRTEVKAMFKARSNVRMHVVNHMHSVTPKAAAYIAKLLNRSGMLKK